MEFKRQVAQEYLGGETLHRLSIRHYVSRNLIRLWVEKYEAGAFDEDAVVAEKYLCVRDHRPRGLSISEGCRLRGLPRSTF